MGGSDPLPSPTPPPAPAPAPPLSGASPPSGPLGPDLTRPPAPEERRQAGQGRARPGCEHWVPLSLGGGLTTSVPPPHLGLGHSSARSPPGLPRPTLASRTGSLPSSAPPFLLDRSGPVYTTSRPGAAPIPCPPSSNNRSALSAGGRPPPCAGDPAAPPPAAAPCLRDRDGGRGRGGGGGGGVCCGGLAARALGGKPAPPRPRNNRRPPALRGPGRPRRRRPAELPPCGRHPPRPRPAKRAAPGGCHLEALRAPRWRDRGAGPEGKRRRERASGRTCFASSVRPSLPGLAGAAARRARWGALTGGRSSLLHSSASLARSLPPARPFPSSSTAAPSSPGGRRGRRGSGSPQALAGLESGGWNPPGALNSRAPRCCVSASSWGPGPGGRSGGRGRAGPSGGRARLAQAGGRREPDGRGRQPDGRAAGAGLRDPLRRSRFPHKLPESGASAALLPASSSLANQRRAPRPAPPISRPALRWPRQPIRPSAPPPGLRPIRTVGRSSQRRGQHEAAGGGGAGSGGAWGEGYGAKGGGVGGGFLCRLLGFSLRLQSRSPYPMVTRP